MPTQLNIIDNSGEKLFYINILLDIFVEKKHKVRVSTVETNV